MLNPVISGRFVRRLAILFVIVIAFTLPCEIRIGETAWFSQSVIGQELDNPEQSAEQTAPINTKPEAPEKIDVNPVARDDEISTRLNEILESTEWFILPAVTVENGVVFLEGEARKVEFKNWATELAGNTQDVAAVVNRMSITEQSIWDFGAAWAGLREFQAGTIQAIPFLIFGLIVLLATWLLAKLAGTIADKVFTTRMPNSLLRWVATRAIMLPILIFGIYLVLRVSGLTQLALTVLGGTGLFGLVIGIAFRDIAENFLASILISVQKPFRIDDTVEIDEHLGIVQRVTTRGTTLMSFDGNLVQIPNSQVYKSTIINYTASPARRISFDIGIGYDDSTSEAQQVVLTKVKEHAATLSDPPPRVLIESLGASTVNLRVLFWIDGTEHDFLSVGSSVMRIAKQALQLQGISMPDEAREVIFPDGVPLISNNGRFERRLSSSEDDKRASSAPASHANRDLRSDATSRKTAAMEKQPKEEASTEAEGNLQSDFGDLKRQAKASWLPGEGSDVLVGDEDGNENGDANSEVDSRSPNPTSTSNQEKQPYEESSHHQTISKPTETMAKQAEDARANPIPKN